MLVLKKRFDIVWEVYVGAAAVKGAKNCVKWDFIKFQIYKNSESLTLHFIS
jgi:hypothetical protein